MDLLNVYFVLDGDIGINMNLIIIFGCEEVENNLF